MKIQGFSILLDGRQVYSTNSTLSDDIEIYLSMKIAGEIENFDLNDEIYIGERIISVTPSATPGFEYVLISSMYSILAERREVLKKIVNLSEGVVHELGREKVISISLKFEYVRAVKKLISDANDDSGVELMRRPKVERS